MSYSLRTSTARSFVLSAFCLSTLALLPHASLAQEANVLGLPAIPQPKPGQTPAANIAPGTVSQSKGKTSTSSGVQVQATRAPIAGELGIQHSARDGVGRIIVTTRSTFGTAAARDTALDAGRLVQREIAQACGKQCRPEKMSAPKILSSGQLEFEIVFRPLYQHLQQTQMLAAIQGQPMNLTPAQLTAPNLNPPSPTSLSGSATATVGK